MKQFYFLILLFVSNLIYSQNFADTKGELQISGSGTATYNLPIALPPSIKNVTPVINLTYSSGVRGGIAGQGWNISGISAISRIATRRDIDGFVDGVNFYGDDKLALDGQRLLLKTGSYWASGSTYETEYKSNTKIEYVIESSKNFFIVTSSDGSRSWYGSTGNGTYQNAVSGASWYIVRFEDVNGNRIDYNYENVVYNSTNQLYISSILFSGNPTAGISFQNSIVFEYNNSKRIECDYVFGTAYYTTRILKFIKVNTNNVPFRKYQINHYEDISLGYQRVSSIKEINAQDEESNPVEFDYYSTPTSTTRTEKSYTNNLAFDRTDLSGDFDGDGQLDFVSDNQIFTKLFKNDAGNAPINLPFVCDARQKFTATTISNGKLNQFQSIMFADETATQINFKSYNNLSSISESVKTINFNNNYSSYQSSLNTDIHTYGSEYYTDDYIQDCITPTQKQSNEYLEGDFNGDGISEVLITNKVNERYYYASTTDHSEVPEYESVYNEEYGYWYDVLVYHYRKTCEVKTIDDGKEFYLLNLDPNASTTLGSSGYVQLANSSVLGGDKKIIADFNGDGKSDILVINSDKTYKIISFRQLTVSPWIELEVIGSGILDKYSNTKKMLLGDYNGDGNTDIMLPDTEGGSGQALWHIYYSNPYIKGVSFFVKESHNIIEYWPDTGSYYTTQRHWSNYYAMDINGDGKSDLVRVWVKYYNTDWWDLKNHDTKWQVTGFTNNIGKVDVSGFTQTYDSGAFDSGSPDIPIPVASNYKYNGANTDLIIVRGHYNQVEYYKFNKDVDTDNRLKSVSESNGNIVHTIDYLPMVASDEKYGTVTDFYSSAANGVSYPNIEIIRNPKSFLVSKLTSTINNVSKYQDFRYRGYVLNCNYGALGFTKTTRSNWYLSPSDQKIWTTWYNDASLRGANTIIWASKDGSTVFNTTPTNLISTKTNVFNTYTNPTSKVYNVLLDTETVTDDLTGIKRETIFTYDGTVNSPDYYGLKTKSVLNSYSGASLQGSTTVDSQYDSNPTGDGSAYYIGRPKKVNTSYYNVASGDTRTTEESFIYTGTNLTKIEKKGHNTYAIVEDMTHDALGNILTKTVSAPAAIPAPTARTITDEYDASKRFVEKKTDHQGFTTNFVYNALGQVTHSTDYLGMKSDFEYDNWGKLIKTTVTNSTAQPLTTAVGYAKLSSGGYTVTSTTNLDGKTVTEYDVLGRVVKSSTKGFTANTMVSKQIVYDALGRKQKESGPYFSTPNLWTSYEYDYLMRPTKITAPTGKIQTLSYSGLTTTKNDDGKTTTITVDALGNKVQTTDPGGTINFTYFANEQLKESDYQGNKVVIEIDGWGNKIKMTDPSAGIYTYSYDAFGQLKTETTPNGTTSFIYDNAGKPTEKTIVGTSTNSKTIYAYNSVNQITSTTYSDYTVGTTTTNIYEYDNLKRLFKTTETTPYAVFVKQLSFDALGRVDKETSIVTASGKTSSKTVKNTYQNGFLWQILDDATQQVLWQTNSINERGQLLTAALGNGIAVTNNYDSYGYVTQMKHDIFATSANVMTLNTSFEIKRGNLNSRTNSLFNRNETFKYDTLDRLTEFTNGQGIQEAQFYDDKGRITDNSLGTYEYDTAKTYQNKAIRLVPEALDYFKNRGGLTDASIPRTLIVSYNTFKAPVQIEEAGIDKISFTYNDGNDRSSMFYGSLQDDKLLRAYRKHYSADGTMEIKQNMTTGTIEFFTYIGGDGYSAPVVLKSDGTTQNYLYLHRDYQGSILAITNEAGAVIEKRLFDAWGAVLQVQDGTGNILSGLTILDRGYTGHEHLQSVGLIHMNGRLYDPKLHRFLQPDNYVEDPSNTQNYNRYGYVLNNPLKYTDPSGEFKINWNDIIAGAAIVVGVVLCFTPAAVLGGSLVVTGVTHFGAAYNEFKKTGDWNTASNNAGISFSTSFDTNWGYKNDKDKKNGDAQSDSVVKSTGGVDGGGKGNSGDVMNTYILGAGFSGNAIKQSIVKSNLLIESIPLNTVGQFNLYEKGTLSQIRSLTKASKILTKSSYAVGYIDGLTKLYEGDITGASISAGSNYFGEQIGAIFGWQHGFAWTATWTFMDSYISKTELYNRIFFGENSATYREREKYWWKSKILKN